MGNGSGALALSTSTPPSAAATTSTSPVARLALSAPSLRRVTSPVDLEAVLRAQVVGDLLVAHDHLHDAAGVAQVEERDPAVIAPPRHPPGQGDGLADVLGTQGAGVVGADHGWSSFSCWIRWLDRSSRGTAVCSPVSIDLTCATPASRSRSPITIANAAPDRSAPFIAPLRPRPP